MPSNTDLKSRLEQCESLDSIASLLQCTDPSTLSPRDVGLIARKAGKMANAEALRIAYLADHTIEPLPAYVTAAGLCRGIPLGSYTGKYGQYFQEVLLPDGDLARFDPAVVFLSLTMKALSPALHDSFLELDGAQRRGEVDRVLSGLREWADAAKRNTGATILIANFPRPLRPRAGVADGALDPGEQETWLEINLRLLREFRDDPRVLVFDMDRVLSRVGRAAAHDPKMYWLAKMIWSESALPAIADEIIRMVIAASGSAKKCLVLDLDNTLWGGVAGEDGAAGIRIGPGTPEGEAYHAFQHAVRALRERGVILALCSKNNPEDVEEVFRLRTEMPLTLDDFAAARINWKPKHENLADIAASLNIGTDSLVFVDDNPAECELVSKLMPEVRTVLLPADPSRHAELLLDLMDFEKTRLTAEDRDKTRQYHDNRRREEYRHVAVDLSSYLEGLGTVVKFLRAGRDNLARAHQLFAKTNQFNLTTRRYSLPEVEAMTEDSGIDLVLAEVSDNFGSMGIVGLYLVRRAGDVAIIDSFLLSCRALGRGVETAMMNRIKQEYLVAGAIERIEAQYIPTRKNPPAASFCTDQGFVAVGGDGTRFVLRRGDARALECAGISIEPTENA